MQLGRRHFWLLGLLLAVTTQLGAADIVGRLLKDTVATFSDSYDLLYYSLKTAVARDLHAQASAIRATQNLTDEKIAAYLESKGISARRDSQPITRRDFARLVIERFDLPKGFFTRIFATPSWYFRDAVRAGLFAESESGDSTMSTREMLSVYSRAEELSRAR